MNSHETRELHGEFLDGVLSEERNLLVKKHLESCPECQADLESLRKTIHLVSSAPREAAPDTVLKGIMAQIRSPQTAAPQPRRTRSLMPALQSLAALLVIGIFLRLAIQERSPIKPLQSPGPRSSQHRAADLGQAGDAQEVASRELEEEGDQPGQSLKQMQAAARNEDLQEVVLLDNRGRVLLSQQGVLPPRETYSNFAGRGAKNDSRASREIAAAAPKKLAPSVDNEITAALSRGRKDAKSNNLSPFEQIRWMESKFRSNAKTKEIIVQSAHRNAFRFSRTGGRTMTLDRAMKESAKAEASIVGKAKRKAFLDKSKAREKKRHRQSRMVLQLKFYQRLVVVSVGDKKNRQTKMSETPANDADDANNAKPSQPGHQYKSGPDRLRPLLIKRFRGAYLNIKAGRQVVVLENLSRKSYENLARFLKQQRSLKIRADRVVYRIQPVRSTNAGKNLAREPVKQHSKELVKGKGRTKRPVPPKAPAATATAMEDTITVEIVLATGQPIPVAKKSAAKKK